MASSKVYEVRLHVTEHNLGTVLGALAGSSTLVSVTPTQETAQARSEPMRVTRYQDGVRDKGISGKDLALQTLGSSARVFDMREIQNVFVNHKFAGNSASPVLSHLVREGKVRALGNGKFCLSGTAIKL